MCRMIGFSFQRDSSINNLFKSLQDMSKNGLKSPHPHGFGIYALNEKNEVLFHKFEEPIYEKEISFPNLKIGIIHARKASPNFPIGFLQIHPFVDDKGTAFCHNGTIFTLKRNNIKYSFPKKVLKEASDIDTAINSKEIDRRKDFRNLNIITIDGKDAKDLDDAVHIKKLNSGNFELGVHIADVTHYVGKKSSLHLQA